MKKKQGPIGFGSVRQVAVKFRGSALQSVRMIATIFGSPRVACSFVYTSLRPSFLRRTFCALGARDATSILKISFSCLMSALHTITTYFRQAFDSEHYAYDQVGSPYVPLSPVHRRQCNLQNIDSFDNRQ